MAYRGFACSTNRAASIWFMFPKTPLMQGKSTSGRKSNSGRNNPGRSDVSPVSITRTPPKSSTSANAEG